MTIYSWHRTRGKVQILASSVGPEGVSSVTVTSVDEESTAAPLVDALNRISATATIPLGVRDERERRFDSYPRDHLRALVDSQYRDTLLVGSHSLWYEFVKLHLHGALTDLDEALRTMPAPVRTAVQDELVAEHGALLVELAEYEGAPAPDYTGPIRRWDDDYPFVPHAGGMPALSNRTRKGFDRWEKGLSAEDLAEAVDHLRMLFDVAHSSTNENLQFDEVDFSIFVEPVGEGRTLFLTIDAPKSGTERDRWTVSISRWDNDLEDDGGASGDSVLDCVLPAVPSREELVAVVDALTDQQTLETWAHTAVGAALPGTSFTVTRRYLEVVHTS
ncbi:hypothetical protein [Cryptosporangium aurantiacum]|uniref:Uncharacterized protein n=1 Tax=Cryptosporangium aurantiacum TaxID=134849 RepID=A0A1M7PT85_9ACTN|nr:hypothetical protein [Cryptosporangium aurantiacum]SHN20689.1 hypothetical protein SAMN05443668_103661 [Cryptosporangium aurantiacum]